MYDPTPSGFKMVIWNYTLYAVLLYSVILLRISFNSVCPEIRTDCKAIYGGALGWHKKGKIWLARISEKLAAADSDEPDAMYEMLDSPGWKTRGQGGTSDRPIHL